MRRRVYGALFLSLVLIVGAGLFRHSKESGVTPSLASLGKYSYQAPVADEFATNIADLSAAVESSEEEDDAPLTTTDLIGRQMIMDYVSLATSGKATEENLDLLASKYVEGIPNVVVAPSINLIDLETVPTTKENLVVYDTLTTKIESERLKVVSKAFPILTNPKSSDAALEAAAKSIGLAYQAAAERFKTIEVPSALADLHFRLVNNYLATAFGFNSIASIDSANAFAGLILADKSMREEKGIVNQIIAVLIKNGL